MSLLRRGAKLTRFLPNLSAPALASGTRLPSPPLQAPRCFYETDTEAYRLDFSAADRGSTYRRKNLLLERLLICAVTGCSLLEAETRSFSTGSTPNSAPVHIEDESFCRQRNVVVLGNRIPILSPDNWVAPNAVIVGDVDLFDRVSIWYGCVLRGDLNNIKVGAFSNIQDRTIIHAARTSPTGLSAATSIGRYVTIGQACLLRSTTIEHEVVIGDGSILMEGSLVEQHCILAPGTVVPPSRLIPSGQLWAGNPARFVRNLTKDEKAEIQVVATGVFPLNDQHRKEFQLPSFQYIDAERVRSALEEGAAAGQQS